MAWTKGSTLPDSVLSELETLQRQHPAHAELIAATLAYLTKRQAHIQYPQFAAQGLPLGSGSVESANKIVVEARLKGSGMHWARQHVNPMLALRNIACNDRWEQTWPHIVTQLRSHALTPHAPRLWNQFSPSGVLLPNLDPDRNHHVSDAELIERAGGGDEEAWRTLVRAHQEAVFRLAYLIVGNAPDAEDVGQEAFIRAFKALDRFDTSRPMRPWLLRITTNLAYNRRRGAGRYLAALQRLFQAAPAPSPRPLEVMQQQMDADALWQAVQRLATADQQIIYLRYFLALSEAESAEVLDVARGTVKSRLHRALGRLRTVIEREFPALAEARV